MLAASKQPVMRNKILAGLPHEELIRLRPYLERVHLKKHETVYLIGDDVQCAYLVESGLLSLTSTTESGATIEVAMVGSEGGVGLPVISREGMIPFEVTVQFTTEALKIGVKQLQEEFDKGDALHEFVLHYLSVLIAQISQSTICNRFHSLEERLSRWLLIVQDRVNKDNLNLTQESISNALGVPRTAITMAIGKFQRDGIIRNSRGKIHILDRTKLEISSCECYRIMRDALL